MGKIKLTFIEPESYITPKMLKILEEGEKEEKSEEEKGKEDDRRRKKDEGH